MKSAEAKSPSPEPKKIRCQVYVDPLFGSERYIEFDPSTVAEAEDQIYRVTPWRKYPVTLITFKNGRRYRVMGHRAEEIKAARGHDEGTGEDA
jgi:hypothetical protein